MKNRFRFSPFLLKLPDSFFRSILTLFLVALTLSACGSSGNTNEDPVNTTLPDSSEGSEQGTGEDSSDDSNGSDEEDSDGSGDEDNANEESVIELNYDFDAASVSQSSGWGYISANYGTITSENNLGFQNSAALSYTDDSATNNINNQAMLLHVWGNNNPWSAELANAKGREIKTVSMRVKVVKASGNSGNETVKVKHQLLPWNVSGTNKFEKVEAAQVLSPNYQAIVQADDFGEWMELRFIDINTNSTTFVIPETWVKSDNSAVDDVLPAFFFGGLEVGDKVYIDDYQLSITDKAGGSDSHSGGYGFHDGSGTYTQISRATPLPVVDSDFYTESTLLGETQHFVNDFGADNTDDQDDSATLQQALDVISAQSHGGTLIIPAGNYHFRAVQLRSNVHLEIEQGAVFKMAAGGGYNVTMFEVGTSNNPKVENMSLVGLGDGFTIDLREAPNERTAVFKMGYMENFKFSNFTIEDGKTVFASFLVGVTPYNNELVWPVGGIIEKIDQRNSLFGYGVIQTYAADRVLFRDLHSEGGITLRLETDHLSMKEYKSGGIRDIYAENISGTNCLAPVMFGPHFQENGSVQVNGVTANGCGFAVRVDGGFVELFSPAGETHTQASWKAAVDAEIGVGCSAQPYGRGVNQFAARINQVGDCLDVVHQKYGLKPGWFKESYIYDVTYHYGNNAHLKQNQLDYFDLGNPTCESVCLPTKDHWPKQGQIYLGPSIGGSVDYNKPGVDYNFNINIQSLEMQGFSDPHHIFIDENTTANKVCDYYGMAACPVERWSPSNN